jgi:hypothetical protein
MSPFPRLCAYSGVRSSGEPLVLDGKLSAANCAALARYGLVTVDVNSMLLHPEIRAGLKAASPNVRIAGYWLARHWWLAKDFVPQANDKSMNAEIQRMLLRTDGFLPNPVLGYEVAWEKKAVADGYTEIVVSAFTSGLFDDAFIDYCAPEIDWTGYPPSTPETDAAAVANFKILVQRLHATGGKDFRVFGNGTGASKLSCEGTMVEGFPGTVGPWSKALNQLPGDWLKSECRNGQPGDARLARVTLGTACLTGAFATHGTSHYTEKPYDCTWWFPEYAVTPTGIADPTGQYVGWLGEAKGTAVDGGNGLWSRNFDNGVVIVNTTKGAIVKDLLMPVYKRIGSSVAERYFTVGAEDALFLWRP